MASYYPLKKNVAIQYFFTGESPSGTDGSSVWSCGGRSVRRLRGAGGSLHNFSYVKRRRGRDACWSLCKQRDTCACLTSPVRDMSRVAGVPLPLMRIIGRASPKRLPPAPFPHTATRAGWAGGQARARDLRPFTARRMTERTARATPASSLLNYPLSLFFPDGTTCRLFSPAAVAASLG